LRHDEARTRAGLEQVGNLRAPHHDARFFEHVSHGAKSVQQALSKRHASEYESGVGAASVRRARTNGGEVV
jgi:hypothetical protein